MEDKFTRNLEETNVIRSEKASSMEEKYQSSPDPWQNGKRGLYDPLMESMVKNLLESTYDLCTKKRFLWVDIGCGGGNVGRAISKALKDRGLSFDMFGCDISPTAIEYLKADPTSPYSALQCVDIENITDEEATRLFGVADVISMVEMMYYLGEKKPWKPTIDRLWNSLRSGSIVVVADGLISYQYRDYLKSKDDARLLCEYTDMDTPVCREISDNGREWNRYLKIRIYQKV